MRITPIAYALHSDSDNPITGNSATHVRLADEGGGLFVEIENVDAAGGTCLRLDFDDLQTLVQAVEMLRAAGEPATGECGDD